MRALSFPGLTANRPEAKDPAPRMWSIGRERDQGRLGRHEQSVSAGLAPSARPEPVSVTGEARDLASWRAALGDGVISGLVPDLLLVDLHGCSDSDLDSLQGVRATSDDIRIVVLANELCLMDMARLLKAGVDGYLLKDLSAEALSLSLLLVMKGEKALPSTLAGVLAGDPRTRAANGAALGPHKHLTEREEQILRCLLNAYSNKHIARALNISEGTVKVHLKSLMKKIAAGNRTQAALWARNNGIADGEFMIGRP